MRINWWLELLGLLIFVKARSGETLSNEVKLEIDKLIVDINNQIDDMLRK